METLGYTPEDVIGQAEHVVFQYVKDTVVREMTCGCKPCVNDAGDMLDWVADKTTVNKELESWEDWPDGGVYGI